MPTRRMVSGRRGGRAVLLLAALVLCVSAVAAGTTLLPTTSTPLPTTSTPLATTSTAPSHVGLPAPSPARTAAATRGFVDEFNGVSGARPNPAKWVDYGPKCGAYVSWGKIRCGTSEHLDGRGHLVIPATPSGGSALQTKGRYGFTYGTMSAWIKMPSESGYWAAFWALNGNQTGSESRTGEIDATEVYTPRTGTHQDAHVWEGQHEVWGTSDLERTTGADLTTRFHKYSVDIEPGRMTFFFDDVPIRVVKRSSSARWAWGPEVTRPNFLILDLAIRRAPAPPPSASASMLVDRVQVIPSGSG
ncbi:MAG: hypothetical protein JWN32_2721 [Solirubrobacterales bacterium]|nr:hypothetical protein [Solirubrobacterales bacterium]